MRLPDSVLRWGQRVIPEPVRRSTRELLGEARWQVDPRAIQSRARMRRWRGKYRGRRCFILGNGPSLKRTDLRRLRGEITFGLNRIYLLFDELGFSTTFLVSFNQHVLEQFHTDLEGLRCPRFFAWHARRFVRFGPDMHLLRSLPMLGFSSDPCHGVFEGCTVTYVALQLAFYMGFAEVVLLGVDHSFVSKGTPHKLEVSGGDDPNHFSPDYFGKGVKWQLPDLKGSEQAYSLARVMFEGDGRQVVDATLGGKLTVFPKRDYDALCAPAVEAGGSAAVGFPGAF